MIDHLTPYSEYDTISRAALEIGCTVVSRAVVQIDEQLLPPQYFRRAVDYSKVRRDIDNGVQIPGASLTGEIEYRLERIKDADS